MSTMTSNANERMTGIDRSLLTSLVIIKHKATILREFEWHPLFSIQEYESLPLRTGHSYYFEQYLQALVFTLKLMATQWARAADQIDRVITNERKTTQFAIGHMGAFVVSFL
jgi:hypothetical protein